MGSVTIATWIGLLIWLQNNPLDPLTPPLWGWNDAPFGGFLVLTLLLGINMVVVSALHIVTSAKNLQLRRAVSSGRTVDCCCFDE
jgi:hypothetical protein